MKIVENKGWATLLGWTNIIHLHIRLDLMCISYVCSHKEWECINHHSCSDRFWTITWLVCTVMWLLGAFWIFGSLWPLSRHFARILFLTLDRIFAPLSPVSLWILVHVTETTYNLSKWIFSLVYFFLTWFWIDYISFIQTRFVRLQLFWYLFRKYETLTSYCGLEI